MSLNDRLNKALDAKQLRPTVVTTAIKESIPATTQTIDTITQTPIYPTLKAGIKAADSIKPDEFGIRVVVVEKVTELNQILLLPMTIGKYIVDDIQKKTGGGYEVHLLLHRSTPTVVVKDF